MTFPGRDSPGWNFSRDKWDKWNTRGKKKKGVVRGRGKRRGNMGKGLAVELAK